jgi:hypothetical protein
LPVDEVAGVLMATPWILAAGPVGRGQGEQVVQEVLRAVVSNRPSTTVSWRRSSFTLLSSEAASDAGDPGDPIAAAT